MWHDEYSVCGSQSNGEVLPEEVEEYVEKDDSRPFFQRKPYEVGIYISVYDAKATDTNEVGLEHYFLMHTMELLYEEFCKVGTVNIRARFEAKKVLNDMYIERFETGIVMAVGFETMKELDDLWEYYRQEKLTPLIHEVLITSSALKAAEVKSVRLVTKLWEDEYEVCKEELEHKTNRRVDIVDRPYDIKLVRRLKKYQDVLARELSKMRDLDNEMELNRDQFMNCVRNTLSNTQNSIKTLQEYKDIAASPKARKMFHKDLLDLYFTIIEKWRMYYKIFEVEIVTPLLQIHTICENEKQTEIRRKIITMVREMQQMLEPNYDLQTVSHPEMAKKIIRREAPVFLGLLSLVPMGVDRVADIDIMIDEYSREFKMDFIKE
ncbi:uncharacterized protein LOC128206291 isoform X1 [Mya arenaria]|uniref:uncharacterized protein LOC128206291 isoform X1 n=1 Tax=Mya arenaria TaxID=6604 RepID=UPI0022E84612|nr:uncharacterized protein LOC128206291 isoform X1 [Mya arenaria]